jgi:phosphate:Na+ symporter
MTIAEVIEVFGGLAVLLFGIEMLSTGMEELAGKQIQVWLERMTDRPLKAALFGFVATTALQSSSLLMVTMIGLINANLFTLEQAVGAMLGQEIGTTLTGQLIAFDVSKYMYALLVLGYGMHEFGGEKRWQALGQALLGVGIIFLSLETMKAGIRPLAQQAWVQTWLAAMGQTPLLGVVAGTVLTAMIHSSAATTGLTIALGIARAITLRGAISLILGANIGTCFTGLVASLRSSRVARQASMAQIIINLFGVALFFPFIGPFANLLTHTSSSLGRQIANAHSIFNIAVSLILFPFIRVIVRICETLIPAEEEGPAKITQFIDENMLEIPSIAITQAAKEVVRIGDLAGEMLASSRAALLQSDQAAIQHVLDCENHQIDPLCKVVEGFIDHLMRGHLTEAERRRCFQLKHLITDIERVADMAENLAEAGQERARDQIPFSPQAQAELLEFHTLVSEVWALAVKAVASGDKGLAQAVKQGEERIDQMEKELRESHRLRLERGVCTPKADILFVETLRNLERIGDHADNLGVSVLRN